MTATNLPTGVVGFGTARLRGSASGFGVDLTPAETDALLNGVLDAGISFIDTAPDYGTAEEAIGRAISHRRDEFVLSTKVGCPANANGPHEYTVENVRRVAQRSLRRLRTDHIDIVQLHLPPLAGELAASGVIEELKRWQERGAIGSIGVSAELPELRALVDLGVFANVQLPFSMLDQRHRALLAELSALGMRTIVRGVLARGAAKDVEAAVASVPDACAKSVRSRHDIWKLSRASELLDDADPLEAMLRYVLSTPGVGVVLLGTANLEHLRANAQVADKGPLPSQLYTDLTRRINTAAGLVAEATSR